MSVCHWIVEGIGIPTYKLYDYLNPEKCIKFLKKECGYDFDEENEEENFTVDDFEDYVSGVLQNIAEAFCRCDDTNTMNYGDDGDGNYYFLYTPSYPWYHRENEPKSLQEVHENIKKAVHKLCDISDEEIEKLIDNDIYQYGCG